MIIFGKIRTTDLFSGMKGEKGEPGMVMTSSKGGAAANLVQGPPGPPVCYNISEE